MTPSEAVFTMADRLHLPPHHRSILERLVQDHLPDVEAWAYGSRVNGRSHDGSDLDLVLRAPGLTKIPAEQLADFKDAVCNSTIPFPVEVHDWEQLPARFQDRIQREHAILYAFPKRSGAWQQARLGEVIRLRRGHDLPKRHRVHGSVPIVSSSGVTDHHAEAKVRGPGVVIGRYGTLGKVHYVRSDHWPLNTTLYVEDFKGNHPRYVSYLLETVDVTPFSDKAAVPGLNRNHLHQAEVLFTTEPAEQRAIARILGALDDKIELNRRMNETLETMARALFKSWFVDFEPVRAKMGGGVTGLPTSIGSLFPNVLDNKGIPEGWTLGPLSRVADSPRRGIDPSDVAEDTPYIGLEHMPRRSIALADWEGAEKVKSTKSTFNKGDILFGKLRPYFHKVGITSLDGICSTDIVVVSPRSPEWAVFCLACLSTDEFVEYTDQTSTGTRMPRTSWKTMGQYETCLPPIEVAREFQRLLSPVIDKLNVNVHESRSLARTRNALLPKLVSGELRVGDIQ